MEKEFEVKSVGVKYTCDECWIGEMTPTGKIKMYENHATFIHKCNNCNVEKELLEKYPLIRYEKI
jgi:hypothetical protein